MYHLGHFFFTNLLWLLWLVLTSLLWVPIYLLANYLDRHAQHDILAWTIRVGFLAFFAGLYWLSRKISYHTMIEGLPLQKGFDLGLQDARLHLAFLPWIGHWFILSPDPEEKDEDLRP